MKKLELVETKSETPDTPPTAKPKAAFHERPVKNVKDARRLLSRLISEFRAGEIQGTDAKTMCYLLSTYVQITKDTELEERIKRLEKDKEQQKR
jgi:hypothetical protein